MIKMNFKIRSNSTGVEEHVFQDQVDCSSTERCRYSAPAFFSGKHCLFGGGN